MEILTYPFSNSKRIGTALCICQRLFHFLQAFSLHSTLLSTLKASFDEFLLVWIWIVYRSRTLFLCLSPGTLHQSLDLRYQNR